MGYLETKYFENYHQIIKYRNNITKNLYIFVMHICKYVL